MTLPVERTDVAMAMAPALAAAVTGADLGIPRGVVAISSHSPRWGAAFDSVVAAIDPTRPCEAIAIAHVGSTSVPGLDAKAILDIAVGVRAGAGLGAVHDWLVRAGFLYRGDRNEVRPDRVYGLEREIGVRLVNAHVVEHDGPEWRQYLAFRDRLRRDPGDRDAYARLKRRLAIEHSDDRLAYIDGKGDFIVARRSAQA